MNGLRLHHFISDIFKNLQSQTTWSFSHCTWTHRVKEEGLIQHKSSSEEEYKDRSYLLYVRGLSDRSLNHKNATVGGETF